MFTPEAFKDLLLPLLDDLKRHVIMLPLKSSKFFDFYPEVSNLIQEFGLRPEAFAQQIKGLSQRRSACLPDTAMATTTDMLNYFLELEHISHRFGSSSLKNGAFTWSDSLKADVFCSQSSLAFEKANILFNISSRLYNQAVSGINSESLKPAAKTLCLSATIFDWISSNFDNAPLFDISKPMTKLLSQICLLTAQELAFFTALQEQKGLKILARISVGVMNMIRGCQNALPNDHSDHDLSYFSNALEAKAIFHNTIHCLIMGEFWDDQQLPDVSHDLYQAAQNNLNACDIRHKTAIQDYLSIAIMRSGKEKDQLFGETAKISESKASVAPFFVACLVDFREVIAPYAAAYESIFKEIYPMKIVEAQSIFESKIQRVSATLLSTLEEPENIIQNLTISANEKPFEFILRLRDQMIKDDDWKTKLNHIQGKIASIDDLIKLLQVKYPESAYSMDFIGTQNELNDLKAQINGHKLDIITKDVVFVESLNGLLASQHAEYVKELQTESETFNSSLIQLQNSVKTLKDEIHSADIRDQLLGSSNYDEVIDKNVQKYELMAAKILTEVNKQQSLLQKAERITESFIASCQTIISRHYPIISEISSTLSAAEPKILSIEKKVLEFGEYVNDHLFQRATQTNTRLLDLMNKY